MSDKQGKVIFLLVLLIVPAIIVTAYTTNNSSGLRRFQSYSELTAFLNSNTISSQGYGNQRVPGPEMGSLGSTAAQSYSTTNIQVSGVDEADIVKNDGTYIYTISGHQVFIVRAYPPSQAGLLSTLSFQGKPEGLYLDGSRLAVIWENSTYLPCVEVCYQPLVAGSMMPVYQGYSQKTIIQVYDVSDPSNPALKQTVSTESSYLGSRMIGDYAYFIVSHYVWDWRGIIVLPQVTADQTNVSVAASDIYYSPEPDFSYIYTMVIAINVQDNSANPAMQTYLVGSSGTIYVSPQNLYLTIPVYAYTQQVSEERTVIHRIHLDGSNIEYAATGSVPGYLLNQYSLDEYNGYLRVATTLPPSYPVMMGAATMMSLRTPTPITGTPISEANSTNNIYILNSGMERVSAIEGLAPGERIYSALFMGDRAYLDTFKNIDPLFVLDLSDPYNPHVLGELKVTGYTSYLYPIDATHLLGIGKETSNSTYSNFAWYEGVKIALFDVSDVSHPKIISNYTIGDRGTDTPVLYDHKAFLYDPERDLLVLPIHLAIIDPSQWGGNPPPYAYGKFVWQGVYVFSITSDQGIVLKGTISQANSTDATSYYSPYFITRSIYMDSVLYTISDRMIQMNDLGTLAILGKVTLPTNTSV